MLLTALLVTVGAGAVTAAPAAASLPVQFKASTQLGPYRIMPYNNTNKCMDITDVSYVNGALVQLYDCITAYHQYNQEFYLIQPSGQPYWQIVASHSWKCLDVKDVSTANYAPIQQWDCLGTSQHNQMFDIFTDFSNNRTYIYPTHSWSQIHYSGLYNGASVFQYWADISWYLSPVT